MNGTLSDFWATGGVLTLTEEWAAKEAALTVPSSPLETIPLERWANMSDAQHVALCEQWGGFVPPSGIYGKPRKPKREAAATRHTKRAA